MKGQQGDIAVSEHALGHAAVHRFFKQAVVPGFHGQHIDRVFGQVGIKSL